MAIKNHQVEVRLVAEYCKQHFLPHPYLQKVPLGKIDERIVAEVGLPRAIRYSRPFRPEIDAIGVLPGALVLVEGKIFKIIDGLAKLPIYASLVPHTPELREYLPRQLIPRLVVPWISDNLEIMAREASVELVLFCPEWVADEVKRMHHYWTADYRRARDERNKMIQYFGLG